MIDKSLPTPLLLTEYQVSNLRALLQAAGMDGSVPPNPLHAGNTGPWMKEIYNLLPPVEEPPQVTAVQMASNARDFKP